MAHANARIQVQHTLIFQTHVLALILQSYYKMDRVSFAPITHHIQMEPVIVEITQVILISQISVNALTVQ